MGWRNAGAVETIEVRGGSRIVKVIEYHVYSTPSETYFQFRRDKTPALSKSQLDTIKRQLSDRIEAVIAIPYVTDVDYFQDTSAAGRLQDRMRTYYYTDDNIGGDVDSTLAEFGPNFTKAQIDKEIAAIRAGQ